MPGSDQPLAAWRPRTIPPARQQQISRVGWAGGCPVSGVATKQIAGRRRVGATKRARRTPDTSDVATSRARARHRFLARDHPSQHQAGRHAPVVTGPLSASVKRGPPDGRPAPRQMNRLRRPAAQTVDRLPIAATRDQPDREHAQRVPRGVVPVEMEEHRQTHDREGDENLPR